MRHIYSKSINMKSCLPDIYQKGSRFGLDYYNEDYDHNTNHHFIKILLEILRAVNIYND